MWEQEYLSRIKLEHSTVINEIDISEVHTAAHVIYDKLCDDGKVLICGCGGSAADSQHFAAELVGRFAAKRDGLRAMALTTDSSILTALGNDFGFEKIFSHQIDTWADPERDILIVISTSGRSPIAIQAIEAANMFFLPVILLTGSGEGASNHRLYQAIAAKSTNTARIQEAHGLIIHMICALIDKWHAEDK